jgi:membrane fusion protein (multidrug efflux system)
MRQTSLLCLLAIVLPQLLFAADAPPAAKVMVAESRLEQLNPTIRLTGIIDFDRISEVSGEISGLITRQNAVEGALVKQGDVLVELNTDLIQKDMDIKRAERAQVTADLDKVGRTMKRLESLLKKNSASRQAYDDARFDHRALQKKRETLDGELERLSLQLDKSVVRAPFDGMVLEKLKEQGEWLAPGTPVCRLAASSNLVAKVSLPENLFSFQQQGTEVPVSLIASGLELKGQVDSISPVVDLRSKSSLLKIRLPYHPGMIQNMSVSVEVSAGDRREILLLPRDALMRMKGADFVYAVKQDKAVLTPVKVVSRGNENVGVEIEDLGAGIKVVVDGNDRLRPDQPVEIIRQ